MIITNEDELRVHCEPVQLEEVNDLRSQLENELRESSVPGIGLAAPQIGIAKTMAIVRVGDLKIDLINCNLTNLRELFIFDSEGCLSFPDMYVSSKRYRQVTVENNLVEPFKFIVTGLAAVVVQHEMDHWHSKLLPDFSV